jgi:alkylation response protein AidB-like acyl-CoA dehydrogenase
MFLPSCHDRPVARTKGISAFIVEKEYPGFSIGRVERRWASAVLRPARSSFVTALRVAENLLGKRRRLQDCHEDPDRSPVIAAQAVGTLQAARFCGQLCQGARPVRSADSQLQGIQFMLADMAARSKLPGADLPCRFPGRGRITLVNLHAGMPS